MQLLNQTVTCSYHANKIKYDTSLLARIAQHAAAKSNYDIKTGWGLKRTGIAQYAPVASYYNFKMSWCPTHGSRPRANAADI